jgi:hypothetical protein
VAAGCEEDDGCYGESDHQSAHELLLCCR